jgi:hypothetical protein
VAGLLTADGVAGAVGAGVLVDEVVGEGVDVLTDAFGGVLSVERSEAVDRGLLLFVEGERWVRLTERFLKKPLVCSAAFSPEDILTGVFFDSIGWVSGRTGDCGGWLLGRYRGWIKLFLKAGDSHLANRLKSI